ncbi:MAG: hypothetical protein AYK19_04885 [Theionarchaea archaeon DG-70-1]|nr:MAG: hypothetical protein AYK19_04885 [Theionarchaea archaeon DG-70-1]
MGKIHLTESEKELLNVLGKFPDISMKELVNRTQYKRLSSVVKKIGQFKKEGMLYGPFYDVDFGRLCKNPFCVLICIIEFNQSYETVISYLKLIEPIKTVYPVLSPHKELLNVLFLSSDNAEMISLLQLLKDNNIITDYITRAYSHNRTIENPNLYGDSNPSLDNLLDPCDIPDLSFGCHDTDWDECDISILPYLQTGYKGTKLIEILKAEKKLNKTWKYNQIKYSHKKMLTDGLIRKKYLIFPFSYNQCVDFNLFLKTDDKPLTQRMLCNFARGSRVTKEYVLCEDWGYVGFASHPLFLTELMHKLSQIEEIKEKELYQLRSTPDREYIIHQQPPEYKYFDVEIQTLRYPYHVYKERIKEKLEIE